MRNRSQRAACHQPKLEVQLVGQGAGERSNARGVVRNQTRAGVPPDELAFYDALKTPPDFCLISTPWRLR